MVIEIYTRKEFQDYIKKYNPDPVMLEEAFFNIMISLDSIYLYNEDKYDSLYDLYNERKKSKKDLPLVKFVEEADSFVDALKELDLLEEDNDVFHEFAAKVGNYLELCVLLNDEDGYMIFFNKNIIKPSDKDIIENLETWDKPSLKIKNFID